MCQHLKRLTKVNDNFIIIIDDKKLAFIIYLINKAYFVYREGARISREGG